MKSNWFFKYMTIISGGLTGLFIVFLILSAGKRIKTHQTTIKNWSDMPTGIYKVVGSHMNSDGKWFLIAYPSKVMDINVGTRQMLAVHAEPNPSVFFSGQRFNSPDLSDTNKPTTGFVEIRNIEGTNVIRDYFPFPPE